MLWISLICFISYQSNRLFLTCQITLELQQTLWSVLAILIKWTTFKSLSYLCFFNSNNFVRWLKCDVDMKRLSRLVRYTAMHTFNSQWLNSVLFPAYFREQSQAQIKGLRFADHSFSHIQGVQIEMLLRVKCSMSYSIWVSLGRRISRPLNVIFFCT